MSGNGIENPVGRWVTEHIAAVYFLAAVLTLWAAIREHRRLLVEQSRASLGREPTEAEFTLASVRDSLARELAREPTDDEVEARLPDWATH